jgi:hypothetical protein
VRKGKVDVVEVSELELAEAKLAEASAAHARAIEALKTADRDAREAEAFWESCPAPEVNAARERRDETKKRLDEVVREALPSRTAKQLAIATAHRDDVRKREKHARLEVLAPQLAAYASQIEEDALQWIAIDRRIAELAATTSEKRLAHETLYLEARALSTDLGLELAALGSSPDAVELSIFIRKSVAAARRADGAEERADILQAFLADLPVDWRTNGMSGQDQADLDRTVERNKSITRDLELARAHAAGVSAARRQPAEPKNGKEIPS